MTRPIGNAPQLIATGAEEKIATVGAGKRVTVLIPTLNGSTVDIIGYTMTPAQATENGLTRTKHILEAGITAPYAKSTTGGMAQVGIEVTAYVGDVAADLQVSSLATSG